MMVLDTSALAAILFNEPERAQFNLLIATAGRSLLSAATYVEAIIVVQARKSDAGVSELDLLLRQARTTVEPVDLEQATLARHAFRVYGKGRHPAALNFGDCFTYALAKSKGLAILAKGQEFARTDVELWNM